MKISILFFFATILASVYGLPDKLNNLQTLAFKELGSYNIQENGVKFTKIYNIPRFFESTWTEAWLMCRSLDLQLATFQNNNELMHVLKLLESDTGIKKTEVLHIGGMRLSGARTTPFYWFTLQPEKLSADLKWGEGQPSSDGEPCLSLFMQNGKYVLNDVRCNNSVGAFICENPPPSA